MRLGPAARRWLACRAKEVSKWWLTNGTAGVLDNWKKKTPEAARSEEAWDGLGFWALGLGPWAWLD